MASPFHSNVQITSKRSASAAFGGDKSRNGDDKTLLLTYGVEIELIVAYFRDKEADARHELEKKAKTEELKSQNATPQTLNDALFNLNFKYRTTHRDAQYEKIRNELRRKSILVQKDKEPRFTGWTVAFDGTVQVDEDALLQDAGVTFTNGKQPATDAYFNGNRDRLELLDVELISPVLSFEEPGTTQSRRETFRKNRQEIKMVTETMREKFDSFCPDSAGLHVHVGNGQERFDFKHIRNIAMLFFLYERQFSQLHDASRLNNPYAILPRSSFAPKDRTSLEMWRIITKPSSIPRWDDHDYLAKRLTLNRHFQVPEAYRAYNFSSAAGTIKDRAATIEFRQHQGTLDSDEINNWVLIVCSLVQVMRQDDAQQLWGSLLGLRSQQLDFPVQHIFRCFGLHSFLDQRHWATGTSPQFLLDAYADLEPRDSNRDTIGGFPVTRHGNFLWVDTEANGNSEDYDEDVDNANDGDDDALEKAFPRTPPSSLGKVS